jgi:hypothetical protein
MNTHYLSNEDKYLLQSISGFDVDELIALLDRHPLKSTIYSTERLIFDKELNKKGLQPFRCLLSYRINEARQNLRINKYDQQLLDVYNRDGCLVLNDVFTEKDIAGQRIKPNDRFVNLLQMTLGDDTLPGYNVMDIQNMPAYRGVDPQCDSHFDTFHPAVKVWVYLNDITVDHAPLHFAKGSHINNEKRLRFMYDLSCRLTKINEGDFRDFKHQFPEPEPILGPRLTTIIVNVSGFHKRGNGKQGLTRVSARGNAERKNPFRDIDS